MWGKKRLFVNVSLAAASSLLILFFLVQRLRSRPLHSMNLVSDNVSNRTFYNVEKQRRSLLILGIGRSGTSFVSKMFQASGERIFHVFEPLRYHNLSNVEKLKVLRGFLSCRFESSTLWEKDYFPPFWYLKETKYYAKPSKNLACVKKLGVISRCFRADELFQGFVDKCRHDFDNTVVKVLISRLPHGRLSSVIPEIIHHTDNADIRVLHVVRDPRATINSRIKLGWMPDYKSATFEQKVQNHCDTIVENIEFGQQLDESLRYRYKLILYQDIAARPVDKAKEVFKFAGFNISDNTIKWIANRTNPDLIKTTELLRLSRKPYSLVRDSKANINKWRSESSVERTRIIERICQPLLELLEKIRIKRTD
ncbi:carbohydrate sulfotransferase 3-like [Oculina patagonica]